MYNTVITNDKEGFYLNYSSILFYSVLLLIFLCYTTNTFIKNRPLYLKLIGILFVFSNLDRLLEIILSPFIYTYTALITYIGQVVPLVWLLYLFIIKIYKKLKRI